MNEKARTKSTKRKLNEKADKKPIIVDVSPVNKKMCETGGAFLEIGGVPDLLTLYNLAKI